MRIKYWYTNNMIFKKCNMPKPSKKDSRVEESKEEQEKT